MKYKVFPGQQVMFTISNSSRSTIKPIPATVLGERKVEDGSSNNDCAILLGFDYDPSDYNFFAWTFKNNGYKLEYFKKTLNVSNYISSQEVLNKYTYGWWVEASNYIETTSFGFETIQTISNVINNIVHLENIVNNSNIKDFDLIKKWLLNAK